MSKQLYEIRSFLQLPHDMKDGGVTIEHIVLDSRQVKPGDMFYARKGQHVNGYDYIPQALAAGAVAVMVDEIDVTPEVRAQLDVLLSRPNDIPVPCIVLRHDRSQAALADFFYDSPSHKLKVIGVTGTNGKTTVTFMLAQLLTMLQRRCYLIGTLGHGFYGKLHKNANTTPEPFALQRQLYEALQQGAQYVAMEVSSIGVCEGRVDYCSFTAGAFTNLTRDHLDYHGSMDNYAAAKLKFLNMVPGSACVINADDVYGQSFLQQLPNAAFFGDEATFEKNQSRRGLFYQKVRPQKDGSAFYVTSVGGEGEVFLPLLGTFNIANFACAACVLMLLGFPVSSMLTMAAQLKPVTGRMERFSAPGKPQMIVDYAHTPDGVAQALKAARMHMYSGKLITVIGCGGDRDAGKRPLMAVQAMVYSYLVFFTSDNPRSEDPMDIIDDMMLGVCEDKFKVRVQVDRRKAIEEAFAAAKPDDVIVVAGKGHEDYQIFADRTIHFSDREICCELLGLPAPAPLYCKAEVTPLDKSQTAQAQAQTEGSPV